MAKIQQDNYDSLRTIKIYYSGSSGEEWSRLKQKIKGFLKEIEKK